MLNKIVDFLIMRSQKEYDMRTKAIYTLLGALLFLAGWPLISYLCGIIFSEEVFASEGVICFVSTILFFLGIPWLAWSIYWQLVRGKGTPVPIIPTKEFLPTGPYRYTRNPMMLGYFLYLLGWATIQNQTGSFGFAFFFMVFMIFEIKWIEEKELEKRFGDSYRQYKAETPMFIPKFKS